LISAPLRKQAVQTKVLQAGLTRQKPENMLLPANLQMPVMRIEDMT
jgi:hypothetical protein